MKEVIHRDLIFKEEPKSEYLWCMHCERTYKRSEFRIIGDMQYCPYSDCDGDAVLDAWDWGTVRDENPDYPAEPEQGKVYPLYH